MRHQEHSHSNISEFRSALHDLEQFAADPTLMWIVREMSAQEADTEAPYASANGCRHLIITRCRASDAIQLHAMGLRVPHGVTSDEINAFVATFLRRYAPPCWVGEADE